MTVPESILRQLYVSDSFQAEPDVLSFALLNSFAPATITGFGLEVEGQRVPPDQLTVQAGEGEPRPATGISADRPFLLPVGVQVKVHARGVTRTGVERLTIHTETRELGSLCFSIRTGGGTGRRPVRTGRKRRRMFQRPLAATVEVNPEDVVGEINPHVYGHFAEHLERCVYGGIWNADGSQVRSDTLGLIQALRPPLIRYPAGNFASGYHWEDGTGPRAGRPRRYDDAWHSWESNQVGTDEFLSFCARVGAEPFLVVNDGSGTADEAARWVAYCNQPTETEQGAQRAAYRRPAAHGVRWWGVGNEVWGRRQIGHTDAAGYAARLCQFVAAMRAADPAIRIVAVGDGITDDATDNPGRRWNEAVLGRAGDQINALSFHICQPDKEGWQEDYDLDLLHHTICAAPLDVEKMIGRMATQIETLAPGREIRIALDEWNLWLPPPPGAETIHRVVYTLRDALYVAGMFHVFHRKCGSLGMANLAQLVNVLPLIVTDDQRAAATAIYFPFLLYSRMERLALGVRTEVTTFNSQATGSIKLHRGIPYLEATATCDALRQRLVVGLINRHPLRPV